VLLIQVQRWKDCSFFYLCRSGVSSQGCLWDGPPARSIRPIDLRACLVRVKRALTGGHGKSDLPCPRWLPPGPPRRRTSGRRRVAERGRNSAYGMLDTDPMGDNGKRAQTGRTNGRGCQWRKWVFGCGRQW
jgi:hypothetical protein